MEIQPSTVTFHGVIGSYKRNRILKRRLISARISQRLRGSLGVMHILLGGSTPIGRSIGPQAGAFGKPGNVSTWGFGSL